MAGINWEVLKTEYITTHTSLRQLAKKYGISARGVWRKSAAEEWVAERKAYRQQVAEQALRETGAQEVNRLVRLMDTTSKAVDVAAKAFSDPEQFNRYLVKKTERYAEPEEETGTNQLVLRQWTEEEVFNKVDTKALKDMTAVLKSLTGMMRDFYDLPTAAQREKQRIAAEQLELKKRLADAAEHGTEQIEIILDAGEEEWNA